MYKKPENQIFVIFGATGDLAQKKLFPALYELYIKNLLPENFVIFGISRKNYSEDEFRNKISKGKFSNDFLEKVKYVQINTEDVHDYFLLSRLISDQNIKNVIYYLSVPPFAYDKILKGIEFAGLNIEKDGWRRIIVEKPFGNDLNSAIELNKVFLKYFNERQIYRIDHYLGKETVQNIFILRFANAIFNNLWNNNYIEYVEITLAENFGIEGRGVYYDEIGALRDMVQNHLLNLLAIFAMEPPAGFEENSIKTEMLELLKSIRRFSINDLQTNIIRAQYTEGIINGKHVKRYRDEEKVKKDSMTETYVALKLFIDNQRWFGVPFYIRTGKNLKARVTEIVVHFKKSINKFTLKFRDFLEDEDNILVIRIQPDEGMLLKIFLKEPGKWFNIKTVDMDFHYSELSNIEIPEAYERLLYDAMIGDSTLFITKELIEESWKIIDPIIKYWKEANDVPLYFYPSGTWGPEEANLIFEKDHKGWRLPCKNNDGLVCEL